MLVASSMQCARYKVQGARYQVQGARSKMQGARYRNYVQVGRCKCMVQGANWMQDTSCKRKGARCEVQGVCVWHTPPTHIY